MFEPVPIHPSGLHQGGYCLWSSPSGMGVDVVCRVDMLHTLDPMTTPFDCIARSRWRLMRSILLCHNSMFVSILRSLAYMDDFISFESRMNMRPSLPPLAMSRPYFSIKQPSLLKRTCMPCSTIWPNETKFFVMVGTCKTLFYASLIAFFTNGTLPMCRMGCVGSSPVSI